MAETWVDINKARLLYTAPEESAEHIVPLREFLLAENLPDVTTINLQNRNRTWSRKSARTIGKTILEAINDGDTPEPITTRHIRRLAPFKLAPYPEIISNLFDNFYNYKRSINSPMRYDRVRFADWGIDRFIDYASGVIEDLGHVPTVKDYQSLFEQQQGPSFSLIERRVGGIKELHDHLGYPNIQEWDRDDFILWGVKVMRANPDKDFSIFMPQILSAKHRGPSLWSIYTKCCKWREFRQEVMSAYSREEQLKLARLNRYKQKVTSGKFPTEFADLDDRALLPVAARYELLVVCAPTMPAAYNKSLALEHSVSLISKVRHVSPSLSAGDIEMVAASQGGFDDIWPPKHHLEAFRIEQSEIDQARTEENYKKSRYRQMRRSKTIEPPSLNSLA